MPFDVSADAPEPDGDRRPPARRPVARAAPTSAAKRACWPGARAVLRRLTGATRLPRIDAATNASALMAELWSPPDAR